MQSMLTNLIQISNVDLAASGSGKASASAAGGGASFLAVLHLVSKSNASEAEDSGGQQSGVDGPAGIAGTLFPALDVSDLSAILRTVEAMAGEKGGATEAENLSGNGLGNKNGVNGERDTTSEQQVKDLLLRLFASLVNREEGTKGFAPAQASDALNDAGGDAGNAASGKAASSGGSGSSSEGTSHKEAADDSSGTGTLEMLALLVFHSLQAALQDQNQVETSTGEGTGLSFSTHGKAITDGTGEGASSGNRGASTGAGAGAASANPSYGAEYLQMVDSSQIGEDGRLSGAAADRGAQSNTNSGSDDGFTSHVGKDLLHRVLGTGQTKETVLKEESSQVGDRADREGKAASETAARTASSGPSIGLTPAGEEQQRVTGLILTIGQPSARAAQGGPDGTVTTGLQDNPEAPGQVDDKKNASGMTTIIHDLSPLLKDQDKEGSRSDTGEKGQSSGREDLGLLAGSDPNAAASGREGQDSKLSDLHVTSAAVERFQEVLDRFSTKSVSHDLTVKLDIGSEGSLILGMKDLGQTVSVEVRASHDAITSLLQSQKDMIIKNLEGKDIHANVTIDPNSSNTYEGKDRRDTERQRAFAFAHKEDEGFGEVLEMLV